MNDNLISDTADRFSPDALMAVVILFIFMWAGLRAFDIYMTNKSDSPSPKPNGNGGSSAHLLNLELIRGLTQPINDAVRLLSKNVSSLEGLVERLSNSLEKREEVLLKALSDLHGDCQYCPRKKNETD